MVTFLGELVGTALVILLGNGVVGGVVLKGTKNENAGWLVITIGWALAVTFAVFATAKASGAHLNPAVTIALAATGKFGWAQVGPYLLAQLLGAMLGAALVYLQYLPHWAGTTDPGSKLAVFATGPAIRHTTGNFISEFISTFVLLFGLSALGAYDFAENMNSAAAEGGRLAEGLKPLAVGALVLAIGLSLGGTTGYAINPARDLGPRIMHALLPIPGKGGSDWGYAWIPVVAPILGGIAGAYAFQVLLG